MKSNFSRFLALGFLVSVSVPIWAQPPAPIVKEQLAPVVAEQPKPAGPKYTSANLEAIALIGAFYTKMRRAESYSGRLVTTKTVSKDEKVVPINAIENRSSWLRDTEKENVYAKVVSDLVYIVNLNDKTTTENVHTIEDDMKRRSYYADRKVWTEINQASTKTPFNLVLTNFVMLRSLINFNSGQEFRIERKVVDGKGQILVETDANGHYVFDAKNGNLLSFNITNGPEEIGFLWLDTEFDVPLADSIFEWKVPEGATQVAPEDVNVNITIPFW